MNALDNIHYEFTQFNRYLDTIIDPREADNDSLSQGKRSNHPSLLQRLP